MEVCCISSLQKFHNFFGWIFSMRPFGLSWKLRPRFTFSGFFFSLCVNSNFTWVHCAWEYGTKITVHNTVHALKNIKMGPTILSTHLKIILLQYFQFLVFSNNNFNPNGPYIFITRIKFYNDYWMFFIIKSMMLFISKSIRTQGIKILNTF